MIVKQKDKLKLKYKNMFGGDAYTNMDAATKDSMYDNWVDQQCREERLRKLMGRLEVCSLQLYPERPWNDQARVDFTGAWRYKMKELEQKVSELECRVASKI
jgi:hypothetical protein